MQNQSLTLDLLNENLYFNNIPGDLYAQETLRMGVGVGMANSHTH